jgi:anti-sigma regulatory factor (Ser/Thr protein kinase)
LLRAPSGVVVELDTRNLPLGLIDDATIAVAHFGMEAGCTLLLYTDGLVESDRDFIEGSARLRQAFAEDPGGPGAIRRIYHRVVAGTCSDDVAMLVVSSAASGELQRWRFDPFWRDAVERVRAEVLAVFSAAGIGERSIDVEIVLAELLSNQLRYSHGTVDLFVERNDANVVLHLLDKGPGFRFNPRLPSDPMSESGRGLFLNGALAAQFSVDHRPGGGSHARIVFSVDGERNHSHDRA